MAIRLSIIITLAAFAHGGSVIVGRGRPVLRALRGGASGADLLWVRPPSNDTDDADGAEPLMLVRSLSAFCEEHDLDEEAMLAVSRGEEEAHQGWQCGPIAQYDNQEATDEQEKSEVKAKKPKAEAEDGEKPELKAAAKTSKAGAKSKAAPRARAAEPEEDDADDEEASSAAAADKPQPPPSPFNRKMIIGFVAPMVVLRLLKLLDQESPSYVMLLRGGFFAVIAFNTLVQMLLEWRIRE